MELRPNGSLGTCIPNGVTTFLLYTSRRTTKKEYARGDVHENRAECLFSLLKPYLRVFRGLSKMNLPGYVGFFQFLRNFHQLTAFEQAELILQAALDPTIDGDVLHPWHRLHLSPRAPAMNAQRVGPILPSPHS